MIGLFPSNNRVNHKWTLNNTWTLFHKYMTSKCFKITTNPIIRGSSFFFNIKPPTRQNFKRGRDFKDRADQISRGSLVFLFYQSRLISHFDFVPVIPVSPDTTLKEKYLG